LINRKNGCPQEAIDMHATTLEHAKYHLKTKHGISTLYYSQFTEMARVRVTHPANGVNKAQFCLTFMQK
jgi:hypothetical protein